MTDVMYYALMVWYGMGKEQVYTDLNVNFRKEIYAAVKYGETIIPAFVSNGNSCTCFCDVLMHFFRFLSDRW